MNTKRFVAWVVCSSVLVLGAANAAVTNVFKGKDYFETISGSAFDLTPFGFGVVGFQGVPIDTIISGTADTIVQRLEDAIFLPQPDFFDVIDIQMIALSLRSANPVSTGGATFDIHVSLDPNRASTGRMLINHELEDNFTNAAEGTFDSMMTLNLRFQFKEVNGTGANDFFTDIGDLEISSVGMCWSHTLTGKPEFPDEGPNFFLTKCPFDLGIGITTYEYLTGIQLPEHPGTHHFGNVPAPRLGERGSTVDLTPGGSGNEQTAGLSHCIRNAQRGIGVLAHCFPDRGSTVIKVPEPSTFALLCSGLLGFAVARRRRLFER